MKDEQIYFYIFSYSLAIYWFGLGVLVFSLYLIKKGLKKSACFIILAAILMDLLVYNWQSLPFVTEARTQIGFSQKKFDWSLPKNRKENPLFLDKRFRYFSSGLNNDHTAFDGTSFDRFSASGDRIADANSMLQQIKSGEFVLQTEINKLSVSELVALGQAQYDNWPISKKVAFLNFMELLSEDMLFQRKFYAIFPDSERLLLLVRRSLIEGYVDLNAGLAWNKRMEALGYLMKLINFDLEITSEGLSEVLKGNQPDAPSNILSYIRNIMSLYKDIPASEYFMTLWMRYHIASANSFVRFKEFDKIYGIYTRSNTDLKMTRQNLRIKQDFGITAPIISFFNQAHFTGKDGYINDLAEDKIRDNRLYLEGSGKDFQIQDNFSQKQNHNFSYLVREYNPNYLKLSCASDTPGFLYYSDGFDKYWLAQVDGKKVKLYKANGIFKAVNLASGKHIVEFIYNPLFFRFSMWSYYLTIFLCVVFLTIRSKVWQKS